MVENREFVEYYYSFLPMLGPLEIHEVLYVATTPLVQIEGILHIPPDNFNRTRNTDFKKTEISILLWDADQLEFNNFESKSKGTLSFVDSDGKKNFLFVSDTCHIKGRCSKVEVYGLHTKQENNKRDWEVSLFSYRTLYNACLNVLTEEGFELDIVGKPNMDSFYEYLTWHSKNSKIKLRGDSPIELLGMYALYQKRKPEELVDYWWNRESDENLWSKLLEDLDKKNFNEVRNNYVEESD